VDGVEYGSNLHRLTGWGPTMCVVGDGVLVAAGGRYGDGALQAMTLDDGRSQRAEVAAVFAAADDAVLLAPQREPTHVRRRALPTLELQADVDLGAPVKALARSARAAAAALTDGSVLLLDPATLGATHRLAVEAAGTLAFSPDGSCLAVGTDAGRVALVDVASGQVARTLLGGRAPVTSLAFSDDGAIVAAGCGKTALAWRSAGGKAVTLRKGKTFAVVVGFAGQRAVVHDVQQALVGVDFGAKEPAWEVPQYGPALVRGDRVVAARFAEVREILVADGRVTRRIESPTIHVGSIELAGDTVLVAASTDHRLLRGDLATGKWLSRAPSHGAPVDAVAFAGDRFATAGREGQAIVWERGRADPLRAVAGAGSDQAGAVALDGDTLWIGVGWELRRFRVSDGAAQGSAKLRDDVRHVVPVGDVVLACAEASRGKYGELVLLHATTLERLHEEQLGVNYARTSRDGRRVRLWSGHGWAVFDVDARAFVDRGEVPTDDYALAALLSADGAVVVETSTRQAAEGGFRSAFRTREARTGARVVEGTDLPELACAADLDDAGTRLAMPGTDGHVRVYDVRTGALEREIPTGHDLSGVRWFPDGAALLAWDLEGCLTDHDAR